MKFAELNESIEFEQYEIMDTCLSEIWEDEENELRRKSMKAINIIWDVDFEEDLENLPTEIEIPEGMTDKEEISEYITDTIEYCHKGFELTEKCYYDVVASICTETCRTDSRLICGGFSTDEEAINYINEHDISEEDYYWLCSEGETAYIEIERHNADGSISDIITVE